MPSDRREAGALRQGDDAGGSMVGEVSVVHAGVQSASQARPWKDVFLR
jgi:hypothetical protein